MDNYNKLAAHIRVALPRLNAIVVGQIFNSPYYGDIVATKLTDHGNGKFSVYGFDKSEGLPRDNYYPRDMTLVGLDPQLCDVIAYMKLKDGSVSLDTDDQDADILWINTGISWDLNHSGLNGQSDVTCVKLLSKFIENE